MVRELKDDASPIIEDVKRTEAPFVLHWSRGGRGERRAPPGGTLTARRQSAQSATGAPELVVPAFFEPLVAYVRDPVHGEIAFMVGIRKIVRRDPELVARLLKLAG